MSTKKLFFYIIIGLSSLLFYGCSVNEKEKNDITEMGLTGKVKSVKEFSYKANDKFGKIVKGKRNKEGKDNFIIFNEKGNMIEQNKYNSDGSLKRKATYKYDKKGNMIEENWYNSDGSLLGKWTCKYDEKGNKIEENWYNSDGSLFRKRTHKYKEKGKEIEENKYNSDGSLDTKWIYKYDEKGNKIEENKYNSDGSLDTKWTYKYEFDKQGNWIKKIEFEYEIPKFILEREIDYFK